MGQSTAIAWTDHTFNPWWGCTKVSPECTRCYAADYSPRRGHADLWGASAPRRFFGDDHWAEPLRWDRAAARAGIRRRVFCASMADVFEDRRDLDVHRSRLWALIAATPHLDWLLLTKRPECAPTLVPTSWATGWPPNVWFGTTIGHADSLPRLGALRAVPAAVRFVSAEPLLDALTDLELAGISWVIVGGESGTHLHDEQQRNRRALVELAGRRWQPRPDRVPWVRNLRDRCQAAGVAFFFKQWGGLTPKSTGRLLDGREWQEFPA